MRKQKIFFDGLLAAYLSILYLICMSIAAFSYGLVIWYKSKSKFPYLHGGYAKYSFFIGFMGVLSSVLFIALFLSARQGLKLDPPGGDPLYAFTLVGFFLISSTSFSWVSEKRLFIISTLSIAIMLIIALMIWCSSYQVIPTTDYYFTSIVIVGYALLIKHIYQRQEG